MRKKHPELKIRSRTLDFSDLMNDPVVRIQKEYATFFFLSLSLLIYHPSISFIFLLKEQAYFFECSVTLACRSMTTAFLPFLSFDGPL